MGEPMTDRAPGPALTDLPERPKPRGMSPPESQGQPWFTVTNKTADVAEIDILNDIGGSWLFGGIDTEALIKEIREVTAPKMVVHVNSRGGNAWDGVAIYNTLRDHDARVVVQVEGMAGSAASYVAQAGDEVVMKLGSQMMIHKSQGMVLGNAEDMESARVALGKMDTSVASIYAARSGRPVDEWLELMGEETWFTAEEAVDAKLADRVDGKEEDTVREAVNKLNLAIFQYAGRDKAPPPRMRARTTKPPSNHGGNQQGKGGRAMDLAKLREALELAADVPDDEVRAAAAREFGQTVEPPPSNDAGGDDPPEVPAGMAGKVVMLDSAVWDDAQKRLARIDDLVAERQRERRDSVIDKAVDAGKFPLSEREQWQRAWDSAKDPKQIEELIGRLTPGRVPMSALGYAGDGDTEADALDAQFDAFFSPHLRLGGK